MIDKLKLFVKKRVLKRRLPRKGFLDLADGFFIISLLAPRSERESALLSVLSADMSVKGLKRAIEEVKRERKEDISAICAQ